MKDSWINHNTDKLLLYSLVIATGYMVLHIIHHENIDQSAMAWAENAFSTVLGALILILTGRSNRSDGQTANGLPPNTPAEPPPNPPIITGGK